MTETLIVGGLTIDRLPDGNLAPGGSVLHAGLAAVAEGARLTTLTVAGDEPAAREGLTRLESIGTLACQHASATTRYRHEERNGRRVLVLEAGTEEIHSGGLARVGRPEVALVAPIAREVTPALVDALWDRTEPRWTVLLIQGWLRRLVIGAEAEPLALVALSPDQRRVAATADVIVVSTEDLVEAPGDPFRQAAELRGRIGPGPILVVTLGIEGYLLDDPAADRVVASVPRTVVSGVSAVGAGDTFGASLAVNMAHGVDVRGAADLATEGVIRMLEARRR